MKGWIYKELRQSWVFLISALIWGMFPLLNIWILDNTLKNVEGLNSFRICGALCIFVGIGNVEALLLKIDEKKIWGYFVSSTSSGYKGYILVKYVMIFLITFISLIVTLISDEVFRNFEVSKGVTGFTEMPWVFIGCACIQLFCSSFDLPFTIRFGFTKGNTVKICLLLLLTFGGTIILILVSDSINFRMADLPNIINSCNTILFLSLIVISLISYCASYFVSCKLYLKGVERCR